MIAAVVVDGWLALRDGADLLLLGVGRREIPRWRRSQVVVCERGLQVRVLGRADLFEELGAWSTVPRPDLGIPLAMIEWQ